MLHELRNCPVLAAEERRKEGELSQNEAAIAKKIFVAFGFVALALVVFVLDTFFPVAFVLTSVVIVGLILVTRSELSSAQEKGK